MDSVFKTLEKHQNNAMTPLSFGAHLLCDVVCRLQGLTDISRVKCRFQKPAAKAQAGVAVVCNRQWTRTNSRRLEESGRAAVFRQTPAVLVRERVQVH